MKKYLFVTHGHMATGVKSTLEILIGANEAFTALDAYTDERNIGEEINQYFASLSPNDQVILLSDLFGGSVNQLLYQQLNRPNTFLLTGVNLPLFLELLLCDKDPLTLEDLKQMIGSARDNLKIVTLEETDVPFDTNNEDEFF